MDKNKDGFLSLKDRKPLDPMATAMASYPRPVDMIFSPKGVDGVLADLNHAYYHFLTGHPNYRDQYKDLQWDQLPDALPIIPEYGALELKTHPEHGTEMDRDFCSDKDFFRNRPLYPKDRSPQGTQSIGLPSVHPVRDLRRRD